MSLPRRVRRSAFILAVALAIAIAAGPAPAVEAPPGSKNFTPPGYVPNYFSNEAGPFNGGASARAAAPQVGAVVAAPAPRRVYGRHATRGAKARGRTRLAHGKANGHRQLAQAGASRHGKQSGLKAAHAQTRPAAGKTVAAKSRAAATKTKHAARAHG